MEGIRIMKTWRRCSMAMGAAAFWFSAASAVAQLDLADQPLFLGAIAEPNIMFILDDSGSMKRSYLPDGLLWCIPGDSGWCPWLNPRAARRAQSYHYNKQYYNPKAKYLIPDKVPDHFVCAGKTSWECAPNDGFNPSSGYVNLGSSNFRYVWEENVDPPRPIGDAGPAHYYELKEGAESDSLNDADWIKVIPQTDEEKQNFANWYSFYRTRELAAKSAIGLAFGKLDSRARVGFGTINYSGTIVRGIEEFSDDNKNRFFNTLYGRAAGAVSRTPLRRALDDVGKYYEDTSATGPWKDDAMAACRQSVAVLMSDGYWTPADPTTAAWEEADSARTPGARGNVDGTHGDPNNPIKGPNGEEFVYRAVPPYADDYPGTLADVAMYYWYRDLQPNTDNLVPTTSKNPAFWQHMRTFTIVMGFSGGRYETTKISDITRGFWGDPRYHPDQPPPNSEKIDDMWHAAINGHGGFYAADDPSGFAYQMNALLKEARQETRRAAAAVSANSTQVEGDTLLYQARMTSESWSGELRAFEIDTSTNVPKKPPKWEAGSLIRYEDRKVFTHNGSNGVEFKYENLTAAQKQALVSDDELDQASAAERAKQLVDYIRGDRSNEGQTADKFRARESLLGDIVHSTPEFAGGRDYRFHRLPSSEGGSTYAAWVQQGKSRDGAVFVGANDGMLHAFNAKTGKELFAYVPRDVIPKLRHLADQNYQHRYYVDGSPKTMDVYIDGAWRTYLVGSTGLGGRSVFLLDVSNPAAFSAGNVKWEFTHSELGYGVNRPTIVRLANGKWYAVFGNGYNSDSHKARLFLVDLETGAETVIDAGDDGSASKPNGLADPVPVDLNNDRITDRIYAGDLHGNLWKFDLGGVTGSSGDLSASLITVTRLFQTQEVGGKRQPITSRPEVSAHPDSGAVMVFFGTGRYLVSGDEKSTDPQSFYGIVDRGDAAVELDSLVKQTIISEAVDTASGYTIRRISDHSVGDGKNGWYLDLAHNANYKGERVISSPTVVRGRVRFLSFTPADDGCKGGGENWLMEVDAVHGSQPSRTIWDLDGDGVLDTAGGGALLSDGPALGLSRSLATKDGYNQLFTDPARSPIGVDDAPGSGAGGRLSWRELD